MSRHVLNSGSLQPTSKRHSCCSKELFPAEKSRKRKFPNLREDHTRLLAAGDPEKERYALVNIEADRMTNSLNTLREEIVAWSRLGRGQSALESGIVPVAAGQGKAHGEGG